MEKQSDRALTGVRKRQQIENTNKNIFVWVAVASVIVSFCVIALQFLGKEFLFNQKVINAKSETNQTLVDNLDTAKELKANVDALISNSDLNAVKKSDKEDAQTSNLNVILDALPVNGDTTSLADSLQTVVLPLSGVTISELSTSVDQGALDEIPADGNVPIPLPFSAGVNGNYADAKEALADIARVIRPIHPTSLEINAADNTLQMTISGVTYYLPGRTVNVTTETMQP